MLGYVALKKKKKCFMVTIINKMLPYFTHVIFRKYTLKHWTAPFHLLCTFYKYRRGRIIKSVQNQTKHCVSLKSTKFVNKQSENITWISSKWISNETIWNDNQFSLIKLYVIVNQSLIAQRVIVISLRENNEKIFHYWTRRTWLTTCIWLLHKPAYSNDNYEFHWYKTFFQNI